MYYTIIVWSLFLLSFGVTCYCEWILLSSIFTMVESLYRIGAIGHTLGGV